MAGCISSRSGHQMRFLLPRIQTLVYKRHCVQRVASMVNTLEVLDKDVAECVAKVLKRESNFTTSSSRILNLASSKSRSGWEPRSTVLFESLLEQGANLIYVFGLKTDTQIRRWTDFIGPIKAKYGPKFHLQNDASYRIRLLERVVHRIITGRLENDVLFFGPGIQYGAIAAMCLLADMRLADQGSTLPPAYMLIQEAQYVKKPSSQVFSKNRMLFEYFIQADVIEKFPLRGFSLGHGNTKHPAEGEHAVLVRCTIKDYSHVGDPFALLSFLSQLRIDERAIPCVEKICPRMGMTLLRNGYRVLDRVRDVPLQQWPVLLNEYKKTHAVDTEYLDAIVKQHVLYQKFHHDFD